MKKDMLKRIAYEHTERWQEDRLDPDNWLVIPDFGVLPADVGFEGFAQPILTASLDMLSDEASVAIGVQTLLRVSRSLAREHFKSLSELENLNTLMWASLRAGAIEEPLEERRADERALEREDAAFMYSMVTLWLEHILWPNPAMPPSMRIAHLATKASMVADWAHRGAVAARRRAEEATLRAHPFMQRQGAKPKKPKTLLYEAYAKRFPGDNKSAVNALWNDVPATDDGAHPFFWRERDLIDRETDIRMWLRARRACPTWSTNRSADA